MERGSTRHAQHLDDQLARQVRAQTQGTPAGATTREWLEAEPSGDDQPDLARLASRARGGEPSPTPDEVEQRSELGRWIPRTAYPADRGTLVSVAESEGAPPGIVEALRHLPDVPTPYRAVTEVWGALGHTSEARRG